MSGYFESRRPNGLQLAFMTQVQPLADLIDSGWAHALAGVEPNIHAMGDFLRAEHAAGRQYLPAASLILRAFTIPFDSINVLIVGQDPYPTPGYPVGLSFSVAPDVHPLPKSLVNIYRELCDDVHAPQPANGDLTPWTKRGVMLLNRCLTVRTGRPNSHHGKGWEAITDAAVSALNERTMPDGTPHPLVAVDQRRGHCLATPKSTVRLQRILRFTTVLESEPCTAINGSRSNRLEPSCQC